MSWFLYLTQYKNNVFLSIGSSFGVYFISFLIIFVSYVLFEVVFFKKYHLIAIATFVIIAFFGASNLEFGDGQLNGTDITIWVVQPNKNSEELIQAQTDQYAQDYLFYSLFNVDLFQEEIDYIVWPESVMYRWVMRNPDYQRHLVSLAEKTGAYLVFGAPDMNSALEIHNAGFMISPQGDIHKYNKQNLVPLTETFFAPGKGERTFISRDGKIEFLICWEGLSLQDAIEADIVFLLTNDTTMGESYTNIVHSRLGVFIALEKKSNVVVASTQGPSLIINRYGHVVSEAPILRPFILKGSLSLNRKSKIRVSKKIRFLYILLFLMALIAFTKNKKRMIINKKDSWNLFPAIVLSLALINYNMQFVEKINRRVLPQPEIRNVLFKSKVQNRINFNDQKKLMISKMLRYYGVYLEKYYTSLEIEALSIPQILKPLNFELVSLPLQNVIGLSIPVFADIGDEWVMVKKINHDIYRITTRSGDNQTLDFFKLNELIDSVYVVKPLPLPKFITE